MSHWTGTSRCQSEDTPGRALAADGVQALGASVADSFRGLLGEASADTFSPDLLRDEPLDKVRVCHASVCSQPSGAHEENVQAQVSHDA